MGYFQPEWIEGIKRFIPLQLPYNGTAVLSLLFGITLPHLSNLVYQQNAGTESLD